MKKILFLSLIGLSLSSCDFIMKDRSDDETRLNTEEKVVLGTDKDEKGCVTSAGYRWSVLREECIRAFEEGYRLNPIEKLEDESTAKSAYVLFEEEGNRAELFLPDSTNSLILKKEDGKGNFKGGEWELHSKKGYILQKNGQVLYAGAEIQEGQITGDDKQES